MENREYLYELDYLKGASILGVVAIHVSGCALVFFPQINFSSIYSILFNQASRFCIPIFLMIAALLFFRNFNPETFRFSGYISKRAKDLLIPYSLWTIVSLCLLPITLWVPVVTNLKIVETIFLGIGFIYPLYYISVLFQLMLILLPLASALYKTPPAFKTAAAFIILINILLLGFYEFIYLRDIPMGSTAAYIYENYTQPTFIIWSGYFMLGCLIGRYYDAFRLKMQRVKMSYMILIFIPSAAYMLWDYSLSLNVYETFFNNPAENFFRISVFIYSVAAFLFFFKLALINGNNKLMPFLGRYSFGIYLIHIAFLNPSLNMTKILFSNWIMTTVTFFLSIGFSVMIVFLLRKVSWGWIIVGPLRRPMKKANRLSVIGAQVFNVSF